MLLTNFFHFFLVERNLFYNMTKYYMKTSAYVDRLKFLSVPVLKFLNFISIVTFERFGRKEKKGFKTMGYNI